MRPTERYAQPVPTPPTWPIAPRPTRVWPAMAVKAVDLETLHSDPALAGAATTNGVLILQTAAADPALVASERSTALALAKAYRFFPATAASMTRDEPAWLSVIDDANARDVEMKRFCNA